jgi:hypothetical protein
MSQPHSSTETAPATRSEIAAKLSTTHNEDPHERHLGKGTRMESWASSRVGTIKKEQVAEFLW